MKAESDVEEIAFDILLYPASGDEMDYFLEKTPIVLEAGRVYPTFWTDVSGAPKPVRELVRHEIWNEAEIDPLAYIAAFVKLNFLEEHLAAPVSSVDLKARIKQIRGETMGPLDEETTFGLTELERVVAVLEAHETSDVYRTYAQRRGQIESALDRFRSMGER